MLYEAEPSEFAARFPDLRRVMADAGPCLDRWIALVADRGTVRVEFEGRSPARLINELTDEATAAEGPPDAVPADAVEQDADALRTLLGLGERSRRPFRGASQRDVAGGL